MITSSLIEHFSFIDDSHNLSEAIGGHYDLGLVILSIIVACLAAYTAFLISERLYSSQSIGQKCAWLVTGALSLGGGIWAMHFTGMLAFQLPMPVFYDRGITVLSIFPALLASGIVLSTKLNRKKIWLLPLQSTLMGLGIGAMHYIGMAAMRLEAEMYYDSTIFVLSVVLAILLSFISLRFKLWAEMEDTHAVSENRELVIASVIMGIAISAMHYTGMAAAYYFPINAVHQLHIENSIVPQSLANMIVYLVLGIMLILITAVHFSRRLELLTKLQVSEARQRNIVSNLVDGMIVIDDKGVIESFNPAAEKIFGYSAHEVIGQNVGMLMSKSEQSQHDEYLVRYKETKQSDVVGIGREIKGCRKDGSLFPVDIALSTIELDGKRLFTGVVRDITDRKEAELIIVRAKQDAESANKAKSELMMRVSHELRTPMTAILGFGQLLDMESDGFSEEQQNYIKELLQAGHRLLDMINDVLDLSQFGNDETPLELEKVLLSNVVIACIEEMRDLAVQYQIEVVNTIKSENNMVRANAQRLKQVVCNLLSNAIKHNKLGGTVTLAYERKQDRIRIIIVDDGPGMTEEQQQMLFTPFGRLNKDEAVRGAGLGLVICKHLVELMGGEIGVETAEGNGSTFWIELDMAK